MRNQTGNLQTARFISIMLFFIILVVAADVYPGEITAKYSFAKPTIGDILLDSVSYQRIGIEGAPRGGMPGCPALPAKGVHILLPYGESPAYIRIHAEKRIFLGDGYLIEPVTAPFPLSIGPDEKNGPHPDSAIYLSTDIFPGQLYENLGAQSFRGYNILVLKLMPVEYIPQSGALYYYSEIEVVVGTTSAETDHELYRGFAADEAEIAHRVDNMDAIPSYLCAPKSGSKECDLLILTTSGLVTSFLPLKNYHDSAGIITEIHSTSEIGSVNAESIRAYIRNKYLNSGIEYVLIGGDDDLIPARDLYVASWIGGSEEYAMPGDIYYACLDGIYNYDNDSRWGEPTDGPLGKDVDLMAEVYVGRAPVGDADEVNRFVSKTLTYLRSQDAWLGKAVLAGEYLGFGGLGEYGGYSLEELDGGSDEHGYTTAGIPSDIYQIEKLYDMNTPWGPDQIAAHINSGLNFVNHYGHSAPNRSLKMTISSLDLYLSNEFPIFIYSQGCLAGHFDDMDCWAEYVIVKKDFGAFAAVMNARYGYGAIYSTDGASQRYNREFWDAVFNPLEGMPELGKASQDSKEDNLYRINEGCMRWCYYGLNLLGDPTVKVKRVKTIAFDYNPELPDGIPPEENLLLDITVRGVGEGIPVPGSGQFHYAIDSQDFQIIAMDEPEPNHYQVQLPALSCGARLYFYFSAEESTLGRIYDVDTAQAHLAVMGGDTITAFFDDFETDKGWTTSGGLWARGNPTGDGGNGVSGPDPEDAYSGLHEFGYNLYGNYEDNLDYMHLISPAINCYNMTGVHLSFWRCLGVEAPTFDHASIGISTDGENWSVVWENSAEVFDVSWTKKEYDISAYADNQPAIYLRWTMGPTDDGLTYCGWNIDDVYVSARYCLVSSCGDANGDEEINVSDAIWIINYVFMGGAAPDPMESGDANCDGTVNVSDAVYIINYIFVGGPLPCSQCE